MLSIGIKDFLKYLRTYPEIIYKIINSADKKYFTYHFNYFIINNFFEDILYKNLISKDFLYLIEHLLKDMISKLDNPDNPSDFINKYQDSNLCYLLNGLLYKKEVQIFFNSILSNIIEDYTSSGKSSKVLLFEVDELNNFIKNKEFNYENLLRNSDLTKKRELQKKQKEQVDTFNNIFRMRFNSYESTSLDNSFYNFKEEARLTKNVEENELFVTKYLQDLCKKDLEKLMENKSKKNIKGYIKYQLSSMNKNDNLFSNKIFLEKVQKSKDSEKILYYYERNFMIVINIINQLLEQIQNNICLIPPILKYIFKIISDLLKHKFAKITNLELYCNISTILINLFDNCYSNHEYNSLLSTVLFNSRIKRNLNLIISIFSHLLSFKLYSSELRSDYTTFNLYFLDKCNIIFDIFNALLDFSISDITKHIKKSKISNFYSISICYNVEDITTLLNIIKHNINYIFDNKTTLYPIDEFKIIYEKLKDNKEIFKSLKEKDISTINYYFLFEIIYSNSFNDYLNNKKFRPIFKVEKIENNNNSKNDNEKNELNQAQNILSELLMNIPELENIEINIINNNNTKQILNNLSQYFL